MGFLWDKITGLASRGGVFSRLASRINATIKKHNFLRNQKRIGLMDSHKKWHAYTAGVAVFAFAFLVAFVSSSLTGPTRETNAEGTNDDTASAGGYTLSLSTTANVDLNLTVGAVDVMSVGEGQVQVATTSTNGYKLYIAMTNASASLTKSGTSDTIPGNPGTITNPTALSRNTWGYAIPKNTTHVVDNNFSTTYTTMNSTTPDNSKTFAVPPISTETPQLIATSTAATTGTGDTIPIYYGVRANKDITEGAYSNNVLFTAIADAGTVEKVTLSPSAISANVATTVAVTTTLYSTASSLDANVYLLTNAQYSSIVGTNVEALGVSPLTCSRTNSSPMTYSCTVPATFTGQYYIYVKSPKYDKVYSTIITVNPSSFHSLTTMQQLATYPQFCTNATTPATTAHYEDLDGTHSNSTDYVPTVILTDTRNGEQYRVRKLADGNCWMTENLRLELTEGQVLTPADTDVVVNTTVGMTTQPYNQPAGSNKYDWGVTSSEISEATVDRWLSRSTKKNGVWSTETNPSNQTDSSQKQNLTGEDQKLGVYYNWYTATAGTGNWNVTLGLDAQSSICPAGWELPRYSNVDDTSTLAPSASWEGLIRDTYSLIVRQGTQSTSAANDKLHVFPFSLPYSGGVNWSGGNTASQGAEGRFWSAGATSQNEARSLLFYSSNSVKSEATYNRLYGFSVRCVAKTFWSISEMQQMTPQIVTSATTPATNAPTADTTGEHQGSTAYVPQRTLTDIRDGEQYKVRKLADGNVWMTENLRKSFTAGEVLKPETTNVQTNTVVGESTQPSTQTKTGTRPDGTEYDYYNWGVGGSTEAESQALITPETQDRWLSRGTDGTTGNKTESQEAGDVTGEDQKIGIYYNLYTASAGTGVYSIYASTDLQSSICPAGWHLPARTGDKSFANLISTTYSIATGTSGMSDSAAIMNAFPFSMPYANYITYRGGSKTSSKTLYLWNRRINANSNASTLVLGKAKIVAYEGHLRPYGFNIRCVVK